jgi:hypothetical protein
MFHVYSLLLSCGEEDQDWIMSRPALWRFWAGA